MPANAFLSDEQIAQLLTFLRQSFGNHANAVEAAEVAAVSSMPGADSFARRVHRVTPVGWG